MKWLKHMTAAASDPKLASVFDRFGLAGYGLYWRILEVLGQQSNGTTCAFEYSLAEWRRQTGATPKFLRDFLLFCSEPANFASIGKTITCQKSQPRNLAQPRLVRSGKNSCSKFKTTMRRWLLFFSAPQGIP